MTELFECPHGKMVYQDYYKDLLVYKHCCDHTECSWLNSLQLSPDMLLDVKLHSFLENAHYLRLRQVDTEKDDFYTFYRMLSTDDRILLNEFFIMFSETDNDEHIYKRLHVLHQQQDKAGFAALFFILLLSLCQTELQNDRRQFIGKVNRLVLTFGHTLEKLLGRYRYFFQGIKEFAAVRDNVDFILKYEFFGKESKYEWD